MTARPNAMRNWKAADFIAKVQKSKLRLVPAMPAPTTPRRVVLPAYRRRHANSILRRRMNQARWEMDRLTVRAACEAELDAICPPKPQRPVLVQECMEPPPWPTRSGWQPWVLQHARDCALALNINLAECMARNEWGSLRRGPWGCVACDRTRVWHAMRETPGRGGQIPSYPDIGKVFGVNHSTVVTAVGKYRRRMQAD